MEGHGRLMTGSKGEGGFFLHIICRGEAANVLVNESVTCIQAPYPTLPVPLHLIITDHGSPDLATCLCDSPLNDESTLCLITKFETMPLSYAYRACLYTLHLLVRSYPELPPCMIMPSLKQYLLRLCAEWLST